MIRSLFICLAAANLWGVVAAQAPRGAGISLSPAVVELKGTAGQAHRQTLSLTNTTQVPLAFELAAEDIVIENGQRSFVPAGQRADSIAATAFFSPQRIVVPPGTTGTADVTVTVPPGTSVRALAAIFRGMTQVEIEAGVSMTGSLGTLMTFTLSDDVRLEAADVEIAPQTDTTNLSFVQEIRNVGSEPALASGAIAVTDAAGRLVTRIPIEAQRLLPGEHIRIVTDYPGQLSSGRYQAFLSLVYGSQLLSKNAGFDVASISDSPSAAAPLRAGDQ
jgi:hypothetical protein